MIALIMNRKKNEKSIYVFVQIEIHHCEIILRVLLCRKIYRLLRRSEQTHLYDLDDVKLIFCRRCVFVWRCFEMHERFIVLNYVEFLLFLCFDVALKTSRRMLVNVVNTFFVFVECSAFERKMLACIKIAFFVISTNFIDVIILLTSKTLFDFAFLFEIFADLMRIIV
jgi:hypothetical protein